MLFSKSFRQILCGQLDIFEQRDNALLDLTNANNGDYASKAQLFSQCVHCWYTQNYSKVPLQLLWRQYLFSQSAVLIYTQHYSKVKASLQSPHNVYYSHTQYYSRVERRSRTITITMKTDILSVDRWAFYPVLTTAITANAPGNEATFRPNLVSHSNQPDQCYTWCTV